MFTESNTVEQMILAADVPNMVGVATCKELQELLG